MLTSGVEKGKHYQVVIDYKNSVMGLHTSFKECPHIVMELSMISLDRLKEIELSLNAKARDQLANQSSLTEVFHRLSSMEKFLSADPG